MMLQACYEKMGGDYTEVLSRLVNTERIEKYVMKFPEDPTYGMLCEAKEAENHEAVFLHIHTLKGVSQNLGFGNLYRASYELTEAVRGGEPLYDESLFDKVAAAYSETVSIIKEYADSAE